MRIEFFIIQIPFKSLLSICIMDMGKRGGGWWWKRGDGERWEEEEEEEEVTTKMMYTKY